MDPKAYQLITFAANGDLENLKKLLKENPKLDINSCDYDGRTALHLSAEEGHLEVVEYLLANGAKLDVKDRWGNTVLRGALRNNRQQIAISLREHGAKLKVEEFTEQYAKGERNSELNERIEKIRLIFEKLDTKNEGHISLDTLVQHLEQRGLKMEHHPLLKKQVNDLCEGGKIIKWEKFLQMMLGERTVLQRAVSDRLVIPQWEEFCKSLNEIFEQVQKNTKGEVATYIPELSEQNPDWFGVSVITVDGQRYDIGDYNRQFPVESCGKPMLYSMIIEDLGYDYVHKFVGKEPSGVEFNAFTLNREHKPHNACINAGSIVICGLFKTKDTSSQKFKKFTSKLEEYAGGMQVAFNQAVYLSEKETANRNYALAYFMASQGSLPKYIPIKDTLDFYFQMCSVNVTCAVLASIGSMYANYGCCPTTGKRVMSFHTVKRTLQLMYSCGMYDFSGEWACTVGVPAKSGVSGSIFLVVPNVLGMCIFSPRLDRYGNSVRAVDFATRVVEKYCWGLFDVLFQHKRT